MRVYTMSGVRNRRSGTLVTLATGLCIPLAALISPAPASAATVPGRDLSCLFGQPVDAGPGRHLHRHVDHPRTRLPWTPPTESNSRTTGTTISNCNNVLLSGMAPPGIYTATCEEPGNSLSVGDHSIAAKFGGDGTYLAATAFVMPDQTVQQATTTTTITSPSPGDLDHLWQRVTTVLRRER